MEYGVPTEYMLLPYCVYFIKGFQCDGPNPMHWMAADYYYVHGKLRHYYGSRNTPLVLRTALLLDTWCKAVRSTSGAVLLLDYTYRVLLVLIFGLLTRGRVR